MRMSGLTIEILLPVSTVISQEVPLIVPDTVRLSPAPLMEPVLKMTKFSLLLIGAIELLAELCPASPASSRFPNGYRWQCAVHSVTAGSHVSDAPSPCISNRLYHSHFVVAPDLSGSFSDVVTPSHIVESLQPVAAGHLQRRYHQRQLAVSAVLVPLPSEFLSLTLSSAY